MNLSLNFIIELYHWTSTNHFSIDRLQVSQKSCILSEWSVGLGFVYSTCLQVFLSYCLWILSQRLFNGDVSSNRCFALITYSGCEQVHTASIETEFMCYSGLFNLWHSFHWPRKGLTRILMCLTLQEEIKKFLYHTKSLEKYDGLQDGHIENIFS